MRFGETNIAKEKFYATKKPISIWDVNFDNIVILKLVETITSSKYLIGYLDKVIRPLALILPKMSRYVKTFKVKDGDKDKNNKLMSFSINDKKLLEKYKATWTKIDDGYIKSKIRTCGDKVYINFRGLMCQKMMKNANLLQSFPIIKKIKK